FWRLRGRLLHPARARAAGGGQRRHRPHSRRVDAKEIRRREIQVERDLRLAERSGAQEGIRGVFEKTAGRNPQELQIEGAHTEMKRAVFLVAAGATISAVWLMAQAPEVSLVEGFRTVEVASVSDAMEQLYGQRGYMAHDMRPLSPTKFAGPAVTVQLKKEEHKEGSPASQG